MEGVQFLPAWGLERQGKNQAKNKKAGRGNDQSTLLYAASAPSLRIF